ncbi:hypothetical protein [Pseudomonas aeruginosa]|uniref:hypothetical protein n=1 Tax=Pseudomonas aeruginosa TaxID=287 RepID=UPI003D2A67B1
MTYSVESKLGDLLDNEDAKAILEKAVPGLSEHPQLAMGRGFPLTTVIQYAGVDLPDGLLEQVDSELRSLG